MRGVSSFTGMSTRRCHGRRNVNWGVEGKSEGDNGDALSKFFNEKLLSEENKLYICENLLGGKI